MKTYLEFCYWGLPSPGDDGKADGARLAQECCQQLELLGDQEQFPPQLLIFLASSPFLEKAHSRTVVAGIEACFRRNYGRTIPLIGSSVSAVFYNRAIYESGAVLICLASRLLTARVAAGTNLHQDPVRAIDAMVGSLLSEEDKRDLNPRANRKVLTFLPGHLDDCPPRDLHEILVEKTVHRLYTTGGVSHSPASSPHRKGPGFQFTEFGPYEGAAVAALIQFDVPVGSGLGWGLQGTGDYEDFEGPFNANHILPRGRSREELIGDKGFCVLGRRVEQRCMGEAFLEIDRARIARPSEDEHDHRLEILKASPDFILESLVRTVRDPQARIGMEKPVGAVAFHCNSFLRYSNTIHLDLVGAIKAMEEAINEAPVVGGYFDGEIGVDHDGHSMLANWSGSALTLADEVKTRALLPRAFVAFKKHGSALDRSESPEEAIEAALAMIRDLGYPGGIVWVLMKDGDHDILVPQDGYGGAWGALHREPCLMGKKDRPATEYPAVLLEDGSVLKQEPRYFPNLSPCHEALMSQYLAPLWSGRETSAGPANENQFLGLLQIDLGDTHLSAALRATEAEVLDFVATTTANSLARVFTWKEAQIMRKLDAGRDRAFRADSVDQGRQVLIETAVEAFGAQGGYIRIMTSGGLKAVAGIGTYFEAIANHRLQVKGTDPGPTGQVWNDQRSRILNQAQKDASVQNLVHRLMSRDQLTTAHTLQQIGSMGIAHIPGFGDTQPGNLVIQFRDPCRFHRHHVRCLDALALRIGLVAAYIETRVAADFLFRMRLDLPADLAAAGTGRGIQHLVENFRAAAKAQVASLCLWDKSLDKFVLYAQAGWSDASWVNVALYALQDLTGRIGFIETGPVYGPLEDLRRDLDIHGTDPYEKDMFGPSRQGEVLVLGISFRRDTEPLGVLTVFWVGERENNPFGHREGLSPANAKLFSRCAGLVGDYVNARLARRAERLNSEAIRRCKQIGRAADELVAQFAAEDSVDARHAFRFGSSLCELIGENYGASGVFLLAPTDDALECVGSWPPGRPEPAHPDHRSLTDRGYLVEMNQIVPDWRHDLEIAARFGSLLTVSIAVPLEGNRKGILHLVWDEKHLPRRSEYVLKASSLEAEVQLLADTIGWAYHRGAVRQSRQQDLHRAEKRTAQLGKEVDSMRLSARNGLHEANQADLHFDRIRKKIHAGATQEELWHEITTIGSYIEETKALMELIQAPPRIKSRSLFVLLHTALDQFRRSHEDLAAYVLIAIGRDIRVRADRDRSIHAFRNIIHNGARAVANAGGGAVIVTAAHYGEEVQIAFEDNGVGMKQAKLEGLRHDRPPDDPAGLGLGFPVAKGFIAEQGGRLETESMEGTGTRVVVALPGAGTEETDDTTEDSYR